MLGPVWQARYLRSLIGAGVVFASLLAASSVSAQDSPAFHIPRVNAAPRIDGDVRADEWAAASKVMLDTQFNPTAGLPAPVQTEAFIMEDGEYLYIGFIAEDPDPSQIRAFYRDRDQIGGTDYIGVSLDTFNDGVRSFNFLVSPLGVQYDAIADDLNDSEDDSWNALWESEGKIIDTGYMVEMAIPFKQLRFPSGAEEKVWGVRFIRDYPRDRRYRFSDSNVERDISCFVCQFQKASGFANVQPSRNIEVIPTITSRVQRSRPNPVVDSWADAEHETEAGMDLRWGINQDMYLNATLNPDFSQVEADSAQLDINNTFSLYYPEKRTFFLDGADYFNTNLNIVHTRNIADPDYGIKLTGKSGNHNYGVMQLNDTSTSFLIPDSQGSQIANLMGTESNVSVLRYRQDVLNKSSFGTVLTRREGGGYSNTVAGVDGSLRLSDSDVINVQYLRSQSDYPLAIQTRYGQDDSLDDSTTFLEYRHNDRRWDVWAEHISYGKDFRADMGFINRVDFDRNTLRVGHSWRYGNESFFDRVRIALDWDKTRDQSGFELEEEFEVFLEMDGPYQSSLFGLFGGSKTYFNGFYFDEQFNQLSLSLRPHSNVYASMQVRVEDVVDFANTRLGKSKRYTPQINFQYGRHLQFDLEHVYQTFDVKGGRLFTANLTEVKATYQFSTRSFVRLILQYADTEREQSLYIRPVQAKAKELSTQLLYSYKLSAQTLFFVGYSDSGFQNDDLNSIETSSRTLFAKFSYAWQP